MGGSGIFLRKCDRCFVRKNRFVYSPQGVTFTVDRGAKCT